MCVRNLEPKWLEPKWLEPKWLRIIFSVKPKITGDLTNPGKWQQLAILNITYKFFTRMVYKRVKPTLEAQQCKGQIGFRSSVGVDDAFAVFENVRLQSVWSGLSRCGVQVWICGKSLIVLTTTRCFDALTAHGVPFAYLKFLPFFLFFLRTLLAA